MIHARTLAPRVLTTSAMLAAALLLAGCTSTPAPTPGAGNDAGTPVSGGTLVYASGDAEPSCLDPHVGGNYPQALVSSQYLETLYTKDAKGELVPWLATGSTVSDDGLTRTVKIREGIKFTDGTALDAAAVKANFEHLRDPKTASSTGFLALGKIKTMKAVDASTLELKLSTPDNSLLESFSMPWVAIESPTALKRSQEENCAAPVGTGPFKVESWKKQDSVNLVRNADYVQPTDSPCPRGRRLPGRHHLALHPRGRNPLRGPAGRRGQHHRQRAAGHHCRRREERHHQAPRRPASRRLQPHRAELLQGAVRRRARARGLHPRGERERRHRLALLRHRQALLLPALQRRAAGLQRGIALCLRPGQGRSSCLTPPATPSATPRATAPRTASACRLVFPVSTSQSIPAEQSLFEQLQATAKESGIEIKINLLDLSSWYGELFQHNYNLVSAPYTKVGPSVLSILFHSDSTIPAPSGYFANLSQVKNPELDKLLETAGSTKDEAAAQGPVRQGAEAGA